ncbi:MAG: hypothetical protein K2G18_07325, partial [Bacteroidales bacterium]|nr:hypothetical protein [Bacteroidales bacterium]
AVLRPPPSAKHLNADPPFCRCPVTRNGTVRDFGIALGRTDMACMKCNKKTSEGEKYLLGNQKFIGNVSHSCKQKKEERLRFLAALL